MKLVIGSEYNIVYKIGRSDAPSAFGDFIYKGIFGTSPYALLFAPSDDPNTYPQLLLYKDEIMEIKPVTPLLNRQSDKDYLSTTPNTPKVGDTWLVLIKGAIALGEATVATLTNKVVGLSYTNGRTSTYKYKLSDVEFVELVPVGDAVDVAISELESALYDKRGKIKQKD